MEHKNRLDITQIKGVTPEIIKEYKKLTRHERYLEEKDRKNRNYQYGDEEEIQHLIALKFTAEQSALSVNEKLYEALEMLKKKNIFWYDAVIAYYSESGNSYSIIAEMLGISRQTAYLRVRKGINFLKSIMIKSKEDNSIT